MLKHEEMAWRRCIAKAEKSACAGADLFRDGGDPRGEFDDALREYGAALHFLPDDLETLYRRGMILRVRGHSEGDFGGDAFPWYKLALADLDRVIARSKASLHLIEHATANRHAAKEAARRGEDPRPFLTRALEGLEGVLQRDPSQCVALYTRGNVYALMGDIASASGGDSLAFYEKAISDLEITVKSEWVRADSIGDLATILSKAAGAGWLKGRDPEDRIRRAIDLYQKALKYRPHDPEVLNNLGNAYSLMGRALGDQAENGHEAYRQAIECFTRALAVNKEYVSAYNSRADARMAQAQHADENHRLPLLDQALEDFKEALSRAPSHPAYYASRAEALVLRHELRGEGDPQASLSALQSAVADCDQALAINPRYSEALRARAKAHREIAAVIEARGEDPGPHFERALADLDEELVWNPDGPARYAERAVVRLAHSMAGAFRSGSEMMKHVEGAISDFDKIISLSFVVDTAEPLRAYAYLLRAWLLMGMGENPDDSLHQATEGFTKALGREVSDVEVHRMIGEIHDRRGRLREAAQAFETGLRVAPGDPDLQELLKDVHDRLRWAT